MRFQRSARYRIINLSYVILDMNTGMCQRRIIIRTEGIEVIRIGLTGTITTHQFILKEHTDFRNYREAVFFGGSNLYGSNQVFLPVRPQHTDWQLRTGQNHRLSQILQHKAQGRSRI